MILITHVAVRFAGTVYSLERPYRHHDVIHLIVDRTGTDCVDSGEQGFLDSSDQFLNRRQALQVALLANQILDLSKVRLHQLSSEDIW